MERLLHTTAIIRQPSMANANAEVHSFEAVISSTRTDSGFLRMDRNTSLKNFVEALTKGTQLLCCHQISNGFGLSRDGRLVDEDDDSLAIGTFDIERGLPLNPPATYTTSDAYIQRIQAGKIKELSVGANGARLLCDICGLDMMSDWNCVHYLGRPYMIEDEEGRREVIATALVKDARLVEVSLVPRGANEDAVVLKKRLEVHVARGLLSADDAWQLHQELGLEMHNVLPVSGSTFDKELALTAKPMEEFMSTEREPTTRPSALDIEEVRRWYEERVTDLKEEVAKLKDERSELEATIDMLRPKAAAGEEALSVLVDEAANEFERFCALRMSSQREITLAVSQKKESLKGLGYRELLSMKENFTDLCELHEQTQQQSQTSEEPSSLNQGGANPDSLKQVVRMPGGQQTLSEPAQTGSEPNQQQRVASYRVSV